jgi:hypothetical protein
VHVVEGVSRTTRSRRLARSRWFARLFSGARAPRQPWTIPIGGVKSYRLLCGFLGFGGEDLFQNEEHVAQISPDATINDVICLSRTVRRPAADPTRTVWALLQSSRQHCRAGTRPPTEAIARREAGRWTGRHRPCLVDGFVNEAPVGAVVRVGPDWRSAANRLTGRAAADRHTGNRPEASRARRPAEEFAVRALIRHHWGRTVRWAWDPDYVRCHRWWGGGSEHREGEEVAPTASDRD